MLQRDGHNPTEQQAGDRVGRVSLAGPRQWCGGHPPTHREHTAPLDVMGVQRKSLPEALLGFGCLLEQEAERPIVQPVLDVALVPT